ncbi:MAG: FRG domain-containing protein [Brevundimonas sp.]|nr:MAG: FRG domain-containing protein [Brevundimonas sp.]
MERDAPGEWIFRGQSSCRWGLQASVHRLRSADLSPSEMRGYEQRIVGEFRRRARTFLPNPPSTIWEWLILAQHFGLPTRLLDWTENPLVALYFAVRDNDGVSDDGQLFAYRHGTAGIDLESTVDPFSVQRVEVVRPPYIDQRVIAQRSVFTVEPHPLEGEETESEDLRYWNVSVLRRRDSSRTGQLGHLRKHLVSRSRHLSQRHQVRSPALVGFKDFQSATSHSFVILRQAASSRRRPGDPAARDSATLPGARLRPPFRLRRRWVPRSRCAPRRMTKGRG